MPKKILLDCDPGLDDALALLLAQGDSNIELVGVTTVGGNVGLARTTRNALALREYLHFENVPVAAGAGQPLLGERRDASHVHGESGLGSTVLPEPVLAVDDRHAVDFLIETLRAAPGAIHLVATGPLTNIALALQKEPAIARWVASFTIMGGSFTRGNATPAAEFNIYADPEAARVVFDADWQVVMIGLDLTLQALATGAVVERLGRLGALAHEFILPLATFWARANQSGASTSEWDGQAVHDVCAVAHVVRPDLFSSRPARVQVETTGEFTRGMTVVDFDSASPNAIVPVMLDVAGFWAYVEHIYSIVAGQHA
ncbi:nucleoside hydrolase [Frigoribacterium sp. CG_9.8]|uniref:nucleoside hydrolase n=1 Tax=Frigoribacterium sp. CG_9.8 TaxID=2787733 RepID=UPI0018CAA06A|nr:nucleoside hydrolase [Frigoribacterium sp. CG_9.8]MBG6107303.1 purine nucleosidase [Frigoribacterium sp. CG_9.8]